MPASPAEPTAPPSRVRTESRAPVARRREAASGPALGVESAKRPWPQGLLALACMCRIVLNADHEHLYLSRPILTVTPLIFFSKCAIFLV